MPSWRGPAIRRLQIRDGLTLHLPLNEALGKGNPVNIGFLLGGVNAIGREFARSDATGIFQGDEDAQPPFPIVDEVLRGGLNRVSLMLDSLCHGVLIPFRHGQISREPPAEH